MDLRQADAAFQLVIDRIEDAVRGAGKVVEVSLSTPLSLIELELPEEDKMIVCKLASVALAWLRVQRGCVTQGWTVHESLKHKDTLYVFVSMKSPPEYLGDEIGAALHDAVPFFFKSWMFMTRSNRFVMTIRRPSALGNPEASSSPWVAVVDDRRDNILSDRVGLPLGAYGFDTEASYDDDVGGGDDDLSHEESDSDDGLETPLIDAAKTRKRPWFGRS